MDRSKVENTIKEKIEPMLSEHLGGAELTEITEEGVAYIKMTGACSNCPSAEAELQGPIKETILAECPELTDIRMDTRVSEDLIDFAKQLLSKK